MTLAWSAFVEKANTWVESRLQGRWWWLRATLVGWVLALFVAFPSYDVLYETSHFDVHYEALKHQVADPASPLKHHPGSHDSKQLYRVSYLPVLWVIGVSKTGQVLFSLLYGGVLLGLVLAVVHRYSGDRLSAFYAMLTVAWIFPGITAFVSDMRGLFDGYALCWLFAAMLSRKPLWVGLFTLLAGFTDERALMACGFVFLFQVYLPQKTEQEFEKVYWWGSRTGWAVLVALGVYTAIRLTLSLGYNMKVPFGDEAGVGLELLKMNLHVIMLAVFLVLELGWAPILLMWLAYGQNGRWLPIVGSVFVMLAITLTASLVFDLTRSLNYLLPLMVWGLTMLAQQAAQGPNRWMVRQVQLVLVLGCLLIPQYNNNGEAVMPMYPAVVQLARMLLT